MLPLLSQKNFLKMIKVKTSFVSFQSCERGAIAVVFAFALLALMLCTGMAVDYAVLSNAGNNVRRAADAAALAAIAKPAMIENASEQEQIAHSKQLAEQYFKSNPLPPGVKIESLKADVSFNSGEWRAKITYNASVRMTFGGLFGRSHSVISDVATAASSTRYIDIYILVDSSVSMGIGASAADQTLMIGAIGCTFACHAAGTVTTAHAAGAQLRFDIVKAAIDRILVKADGLDSRTRVRAGLYSFATRFKTEIDITNDIPAVINAAKVMDLSTYSGGTNVAEALKQLETKITATGDGSSAATPQTFVILATDGTGNASDNTDPASVDAGAWIASPLFVPADPNAIPDPGQPNMHLTGIDPAWCTPIKDLGARVMTLETEYIISPLEAGELRFDYIKNTLGPSLKSNMAACASQPSYNVSANSPAEIIGAMDTLFDAAISGSPRLIN